MVVLMGGRYSQGYQLFQQLTVKAFLAIRPHADQLISTVQLMLDTSLPSFKGEPTIRRLRDRFALGLNERQAADFMVATVRNAHENVRSTAYDEFQRVSCDKYDFTAFLLMNLNIGSFRMVRANGYARTAGCANRSYQQVFRTSNAVLHCSLNRTGCASFFRVETS